MDCEAVEGVLFYVLKRHCSIVWHFLVFLNKGFFSFLARELDYLLRQQGRLKATLEELIRTDIPDQTSGPRGKWKHCEEDLLVGIIIPFLQHEGIHHDLN
jgi:hypothetical protein